jgi:FkbM family methyltransferase
MSCNQEAASLVVRGHSSALSLLSVGHRKLRSGCKKLIHQFSVIQKLGLIGWILFVLQSKFDWASVVFGRRLLSKDSKYPIYFRPGSSDLDVYRQIFIEREYSCLDGHAASGLILDCGANVGYSAAYFLTRYPRATVIAVEPDSDNFRALQKNIARFGTRVNTIHAGVWSHPCELKVERSGYRDGREWSIWVRETKPNEVADIKAIDIPSLLEASGFSSIAILKMDIERSEIAVFSDGYQIWLPHCEAIVIELHDQQCEETFFNAIKGHAFEVSRSRALP